MVFTSVSLFARSKGPDEFWRKRKIFRLSAHFKNRYRNCYSLAIRAVHESLQFATKARDPRRKRIKEIWTRRIQAASSEHGLQYWQLKEGLCRCDILLDHKSLAELAIWEPRSFKSVVKTACAKLKQDGLKVLGMQKTNDIITRGLIK